MSEHAWILENIETYSAGGLEPAERERIEEHTAQCSSCGQALEESRAVDATLEALFAGVRPEPALEDRMIRSLRMVPPRRRLVLRFALGAAAVLLVALLGAGMSYLMDQGDLPFPGMGGMRAESKNNLGQLARAFIFTPREGRIDRDPEAVEIGGEAWLVDQHKSEVRSGDLKNTDKLAEEIRQKALASVTDGTSNTIEMKEKNTDYRGVPDGGMSPAAQAFSADGSRLLSGHTGTVKLWDSTTGGGQGIGGGLGGGGLGFGGGGATLGGRPTSPQRDSFGGSNTGLGMPPGINAENKSKSEGKELYTYRNDQPAPTTKPQGLQGSTALNPDNLSADIKGGIKGLMVQRRKKAEGDEKSGQVTKTLPSGKGNQEPPKGEPEKKPATQEPAAPRKIIIRSGDIEFEIESFDSAVATITKLVSDIKGGFVATVNSDKLANGKVRGSVVVRVPPERLDTLILDLRKELGKGGELKGLHVGSQDITKQYTDLESRLKAARTMEERLLQIIKAGKGEIKDLLQAEKELGVWRTKIEEFEGELRYYANQVALSTLTITLYEKEIRAPFAIVETERIQMGIEVDDVDKAQQQTLAAVTEAKGRVTKSELKQHAAGQFSALVHFEVAPEAAGPLRDRLRQLGTVARLEIDRLVESEGGTGRPENAKSKRKDAQFFVALYNVANVAPRETVHLNLACVDTEAAYQMILARVRKSTGHVVTSNLNRQQSEQTTATIQFEVKTTEADAVLADLKQAGEVMRLQLTENPDAQNVTRSKRGFNVQLWSLAQVAPRETTMLTVATRDVPAGYRSLQEAVAKAKGRMLNAQLNEQDKQNITAQLDFDVRRVEEAAVRAELDKIGEVFSRNVTRAQDSENVLDSKVRLQVGLINLARIPPRETVVLAIEVADVDQTATALTGLVSESQGRTVESHVAHERSGQVTAKLVYNVPLASATELINRFKSTGTVRVQQTSRNPQVPDTAMAIARLDVTLSNVQLIVPTDDGLGPQVRKGLSNSLLVIFMSLSWVIFGILVLLPWALVIYAVYRIVLRLWKKPGGAPTTAA